MAKIVDDSKIRIEEADVAADPDVLESALGVVGELMAGKDAGA